MMDITVTYALITAILALSCVLVIATFIDAIAEWDKNEAGPSTLSLLVSITLVILSITALVYMYGIAATELAPTSETIKATKKAPVKAEAEAPIN